jgi:CheY-like chemotaxis protein
MTDTGANESFVNELKRVLQHLYDPVGLQRSPLLALFALDQQRSPSSALRDILLDAIEAFKPSSDVPPQSNAWRLYHILTYRYVEQSSLAAVAATLALSERQLRRHGRAAERILADHLWTRYDLASRAEALAAQETEGENTPVPSREDELEWLRESFPSETASIAPLIESALRIVRPLMQASGVEVVSEVPESLPPVTGQLTPLRQALLNLLTAAVPATARGTLSVIAEPHPRGVRVHVRAGGDQRTSWILDRDVMEHLGMARQFTELFGGALEVVPVDEPGRPFAAALVLPVGEAVQVFAVDDNADTLRLLQRYLTGSRYRFIGTRDPEEALTLAAELAPDLIVMDVMLPGIDDWELLGRFRAHPLLRGIPVIICTILPQEQLALALGAAGFLRKPVSREAFLSALDRHAGLSSKGSR